MYVLEVVVFLAVTIPPPEHAHHESVPHFGHEQEARATISRGQEVSPETTVF